MIIRQTPPHMMSTEERLDEVAEIMMRAVVRLKKLQKNPSLGSKKKTGMPPVGTQFVREHDGEEHRVMVLEDGFEYRGCKYRSLSEIARLITGTRWSGPKFFGLKT